MVRAGPSPVSRLLTELPRRTVDKTKLVVHQSLYLGLCSLRRKSLLDLHRIRLGLGQQECAESVSYLRWAERSLA